MQSHRTSERTCHAVRSNQLLGSSHQAGSSERCNVRVRGGGFPVMSVLAPIRTSHSHPNMCPSRYIQEHTHLCAGVRKLERSARLIWAHAWQHREIRMETQVEAHQLYGLCSRGMTLLVQSRVETTRCRERAAHIRSVSVRKRDMHTQPERTRPSEHVRHYPHKRTQEIRQRHAPRGHEYILFGVHRALTGVLCAPTLAHAVAGKKGPPRAMLRFDVPPTINMNMPHPCHRPCAARFTGRRPPSPPQALSMSQVEQ